MAKFTFTNTFPAFPFPFVSDDHGTWPKHRANSLVAESACGGLMMMEGG